MGREKSTLLSRRITRIQIHCLSWSWKKVVTWFVMSGDMLPFSHWCTTSINIIWIFVYARIMIVWEKRMGLNGWTSPFKETPNSGNVCGRRTAVFLPNEGSIIQVKATLWLKITLTQETLPCHKTRFSTF